MAWRDTDPRNVCPTPGCNRRKSPESERCQTCHMKRVHRRRKLKTQAQHWVERYLNGYSVCLEPGAGMSTRDFVAALRDMLTVNIEA